MITIASFFWVDPARGKVRSVGTTPDDVRMWDRMVARHLTIPHRRVCITHRPDLIDFMETVPLDLTKHVPGTCLVKLMSWRPDIGSVLGDRIITMDVDAVVTASLDPLFGPLLEDDAPPAKFWRNPNYERGGRRGFYQGSLQFHRAGALPELWADFDPRSTPSWLNRRFGGAEQAWLAERLNTAYPEAGWEWDQPAWTDADGVYGAGRLFLGKMGKGVQSELPANARIVFFPGDRSPAQPEVQETHPWVREFYK